MAIISPIGRRALRLRLLIATIYVLLVLGAVTMLYPFGLMIAGSTKSAVDTPDPKLIPPFLVNETALYQKFVEGLFNESLDALRTTYNLQVRSFANVELPPSPREKLVQTWRDFLQQSVLPRESYVLGFVNTIQSQGVLPHHLRAFKNQLEREYQGDLHEMNRALGTVFNAWYNVRTPYQGILLISDRMPVIPLYERYFAYVARQPWHDRYVLNLDGFYKIQFLQNRYGRTIENYNQTHGTRHASWNTVYLDRTLPTGPDRTEAERRDWIEFVRGVLNAFWIRAAPEATPAYHAFLRAKYGDIAVLNRNYGTAYRSFEEIPLIVVPPSDGIARSDWDSFIAGWKDPDTGQIHQVAAEHLRIDSIEFRYRDFLQQRYGSLTALNAALGTRFADWMEIQPPQQDFHYMAFRENQGWLRWEFATRNYISVFDYVVRHGRALVNTAIYCGLLIALSLLVNPLAAYALSRYRPPSTYKVLLFLMLTMAFPPIVTQIPVFLMLRGFDLLNTFWALILPGVANGYSIFLLKGFFDSLPRELYESAQIDGASEFRMFWQLTMSLSKPILAVIALNAFTAAYSNFMYALLICQDHRMWTLMPWLYQLQQASSQGVVFASLIVASVPTLLLFIFCQRIIMRGIVVPVEK
ncbi:MAG: ABC transporter permease subunit [Verrucomicrobiae bacterium]|nr:ABC transporter permease subunit [Verrucomicrobiae bacterium]